MKAVSWNFHLPWLHAQRAEVLAALALSVRLRQPLAPGLAQLAENDPSLQIWHRRLDAGLRAGEPLGALLYRQRLIDKKSAMRLDTTSDPLKEFAAITQDSYKPLRALFLLHWFPVIVAMTLCVPLIALQISQMGSFFAQIYSELGIRLPALTLLLMDLSRGSTVVLVAGVGCLMVGLTTILSVMRGLRHLQHCLWVDVHRTEALLGLITAAQQGDDAPRVLRWPLNWLAALRISAVRQYRPAWDAQWRTYRILTRWRAPEMGWRKAARSTTALGVLQALGLVSDGDGGDQQELLQLKHLLDERLRGALATDVAQAFALLMVSVAIGCGVAVFALVLPLFTIMGHLG